MLGVKVAWLVTGILTPRGNYGTKVLCLPCEPMVEIQNWKNTYENDE